MGNRLVNNKTLLDAFSGIADREPQLAALELGGEEFSYGELNGRAASISRTILEREHTSRPNVALLAYRSVNAYVGVLGILGASRGYVPLNPHFPIERTRAMIELSNCATIVFSKECSKVLEELLPEFPHELTVVCTDGENVGEWSKRFPSHRFVPVLQDDSGGLRNVAKRASPDDTAYTLFTSGSTGVPKGVAVTHRSAVAYVEYVSARYAFSHSDRFSQTFEMTFDLSVHDMFVCWSNGACLVPMPHSNVMAPAKFIRDRELTVWFSVPSVIMFMQRFRSLRPDCFPNLRVSLFCGEPLLGKYADAWQSAAPESILENLYGPTEATIAVSHYRWNPVATHNNCTNGVVPIGTVFGTQRGRIMNVDGSPSETGESGELWVSGSQVASGYLNNAEKTKEQFVRIESHESVWYRTGDLVREDDSGNLQYLGRIDHQVQICGHRVEMQEIDHVVRAACGTDSAIAMAWPIDLGRADSVYAFVCAPSDTDVAPILNECRRRLPSYMVPKRILFVDEMPLNPNGKIDRAKLGAMLDESQNVKSPSL